MSTPAMPVKAVVIGASAGGLEALTQLLPAGLPRDFAAPVMIVMHVRQGQPSRCPRCSGSAARFVQDENVANIGTRIKSSGMRMVRMVDQLLNLVRLRGGRVTLQPRTVDLLSLAKNIVNEYEARVGKGRIFVLHQGGHAHARRWRSAFASVF